MPRYLNAVGGSTIPPIRNLHLAPVSRDQTRLKICRIYNQFINKHASSTSTYINAQATQVHQVYIHISAISYQPSTVNHQASKSLLKPLDYCTQVTQPVIVPVIVLVHPPFPPTPPVMTNTSPSIEAFAFYSLIHHVFLLCPFSALPLLLLLL